MSFCGNFFRDYLPELFLQLLAAGRLPYRFSTYSRPIPTPHPSTGQLLQISFAHQVADCGAILENAAGNPWAGANVVPSWIPGILTQLTSLGPVFKPRCKHFNSRKTCDPSYSVGARVLVSSSSSSRRHLRFTSAAAIRPSFDFIYPFVLKKFRFMETFTLAPGHRIFFSTKVAICTSVAFSTCLGPSCVSNRSNTDEMLLSNSPLRAHCWTCSSAAPNVPSLVFSWETHLHQRRVWGFEFRELRLAGP